MYLWLCTLHLFCSLIKKKTEWKHQLLLLRALWSWIYVLFCVWCWADMGFELEARKLHVWGGWIIQTETYFNLLKQIETYWIIQIENEPRTLFSIFDVWGTWHQHLLTNGHQRLYRPLSCQVCVLYFIKGATWPWSSIVESTHTQGMKLQNACIKQKWSILKISI